MDQTQDSDIDPITGYSQRIEVQRGQANPDVDIGVVVSREIKENPTVISSFDAEKKACSVRVYNSRTNCFKVCKL